MTEENEMTNHTATIIAEAGCNECGAQPGRDCTQLRFNRRYTVAPHINRVWAAGFEIINHPTNLALRHYQKAGE